MGIDMKNEEEDIRSKLEEIKKKINDKEKLKGKISEMI
jgi:hypothetical protein